MKELRNELGRGHVLTGGLEAQGVGRGCVSKIILSRDLGLHPRGLYSMTLMLLILYPLKARVLSQASSFPGENSWADTWYLVLAANGGLCVL